MKRVFQKYLKFAGLASIFEIKFVIGRLLNSLSYAVSFLMNNGIIGRGRFCRVEILALLIDDKQDEAKKVK